jgi:hypothetical protein
MEIQTLSSFPGVPFNDTFETFFDTYKVKEDIECYQLLFCPYGHGTCFDDLNEIKFKSRTVILNVMDSMITENDNLAIDQITKFCENHPEQNFIIFSFHLNLQSQLNIPNLYLDTIISTNYSQKLIPCEKKDISNRWLLLNADTKFHRVMSVCYLLSKDYYKNGDITFTLDCPMLAKHYEYRNMEKIPLHLRSSFAVGYVRFKNRDFNLLNIRNFDRETDRVATNYNENLRPVYENIGVEIVAGTMFFEKTPLLSEKEVQSVYGKNFPIYLNGVGIVREIKNFIGIDTFDDIVDHSYDEIENPFERLSVAIDRNEHLLNGSTNIKELWYDNQKRFENNCKIMNEGLHDKTLQQTFNHEKVKKSLKHFGVSFTKKS